MTEPHEITLQDLPKGWGIKRLKSIADYISRGNSPKYDPDGAVQVINQACINSDGVSLDKVKIHRDEDISLFKGRLYSGDLLINSTGTGTLGRTAVFEQQANNFIADGHVTIVRDSQQRFCPKYLHYYFYDKEEYLSEACSLGATNQIELQREKFRNILIPFPNKEMQELIVSYLDGTYAAIDAAIEAKRKQLEMLDALRKSIIHNAVTHGLDDLVEFKDSGIDWLGYIPKHWRCEHLKRVCNRIQTGTTPPTESTEYYVEGDIPWFAPGCYDSGIYLKEPAKMINEIAYRDNKLRVFPADSIFLVGIGATIGKVAMIRAEASCNQQITALVCNSGVSAKYMTYQLKIYEGIIPQIAQFTTLPIMDQVEIGYLRIVLPPPREQVEIVTFLDAKTAEISKLERNLHNQIETLRQYRKFLIHECVTGKRRITENDLKEIGVKLN